MDHQKKEANNWCFLIFSAFPSHNSAKIKKWLLNKDLTLGTALKIWSKDTAKGVTVKYVFFLRFQKINDFTVTSLAVSLDQIFMDVL